MTLKDIMDGKIDLSLNKVLTEIDGVGHGKAFTWAMPPNGDGQTFSGARANVPAAPTLESRDPGDEDDDTRLFDPPARYAPDAPIPFDLTDDARAMRMLKAAASVRGTPLLDLIARCNQIQRDLNAESCAAAVIVLGDEERLRMRDLKRSRVIVDGKRTYAPSRTHDTNIVGATTLPEGSFPHICKGVGQSCDVAGCVRHTKRFGDDNPKKAFGGIKIGISSLSMPVLLEMALGMFEGALKYARHNYRTTPIDAETYYNATFRHLSDWWEGEDVDPASNLNHIAKALSSLHVLRDAMMQDNWIDNRPPKAKKGWMEKLNKAVEVLIAKYPNPKPAFTEVGIAKARAEKEGGR